MEKVLYPRGLVAEMAVYIVVSSFTSLPLDVREGLHYLVLPLPGELSA